MVTEIPMVDLVIAYEKGRSRKESVMSLEVAISDSGLLALPEGRPLDQNPAAVYLARLAPGSRRTMRQALDTMADLASGGQMDALALDWPRLRFQHTVAIRARLIEQYAPATANKMLSALRGVLRVAWRLGQMDAETYRRAADLRAVRGDRLPVGRNLTPGEIAAMFAACAKDSTPAGVRDAAVLALLRLGLRRQEVAGLELDNYDREGKTLQVLGKGNKERVVPLTGGVIEALADWIAVRGTHPGSLLQQVNKGGRMICRGITGQAVYNILVRRADQAGVENVTPHDWRRSFVGDLLDAGADLSVVQRLAGHASPTTTARYDRRPEAAKRRAVDLLHVPYQRRNLSGVEG